MNDATNAPQLARNVTRLAHLDLPGAGQVYVDGNYAYIGHLPNKAGLGTTIVDVANPRKPRVVSQINLEDPTSHSHKARVIGDIMIVNSERNMTGIGRKADELPKLRADLKASLGRNATPAELAAKLGVREADMAAVEDAEKNPYDKGGFKIYDVADRAKPKLITFHKTHGIGVHRFDMDANYAYISTEMAGYKGNILVIYDIRNPAKPEEVSRWWLPGQHIAGGETPTWSGRQHRLHHALRSGTLVGGAGTAACASSTSPTSKTRAPSAPTTTTRRFPNPRIRSWACRSRLPAARLRSPSTKKTMRTTARKWSAAAAGRTPACGYST